MVGEIGDTLRMPQGGFPPDCDDRVHLVFLEGERACTTLAIDTSGLSIGRHDSADLVLQSPGVSKQHASIGFDGGAFYVEDHGSTNGVLVNAQRVPDGEPRRLFHGDTLRFADTLALFQQTGCFGRADGTSRITIDRDKVREEVDALFVEFGGDV